MRPQTAAKLKRDVALKMPPRTGHPELDPYERLVRASPQGSIYCHRWWLEAVAPGQHRILRITHGEHLIAAWPIVFTGVGQQRMCAMPSVTQKLGILFAPSNAKYAEELSRQHEVMEQFIAQLPEDIAIYHQFHENFTNWLPFHWHGFTQTTRYTYILPDLSNQELLWDGMRAQCRGWIRKAVKNGIKVRDELTLDRFLELHDQTYSRQELETPVPEDLIHRLDAACCRHAGRKIFAGVDAQDCIHAAVWVVWDNGTAYFLMTGSDPALRGSGALKLVIHEAIRFAGTVAERFDFEGSMIRPIENAFRDFGARQTPYFAIRRSRGDKSPSLKQIGRSTAGLLRAWLRAKRRGE